MRVEDSSGVKPEVTILRSKIANSCGGGLYCSGGEVILGAESENSDCLVIETQGADLYDTWYNQQDQGDNWNYRLSKTGGHAVEVNGGILTINNGIYSAAQGEGILVRNGTANIWKGSFDGNDSYFSQAGKETLLAGPSASYAFKMYGGTANIYGGVFGAADDSKCSGAFVMGTSSNIATANIYGGTFNVKGQAGFSVFEYVNVTFKPRGGENEILVSGEEAGLTIEYRGSANSSVTIDGGKFSSKSPSFGNGIWYSESRVKLNISAGEFSGLTSGLYFNVAPVGTNVQISGGYV